MAVLNLQTKRFADASLPLGTSWLLAACMEARGKQDLWIRQKPEVLAALHERAIVQSVESSNRIEGVTVASARLRPVALGKSLPRDRPEEELAGYRRALQWIYSRKGHVRVTPDSIRKLHAMAQGHGPFSGGGDAGERKKRDNEIVEFSPSGDRRIRFVPASAKETPRLMERLCRNLAEGIEDHIAPPLLLTATFVFDFLCIHPFRDGNGRVSRLLTALLLQTQGFAIARYVSLERLIEDSKADYYRVLRDCSQGWHEGRNDIVPWWNYQLGIVRAAYKELEQQVEAAPLRGAKSDLVRRIVLNQTGDFTLGDLIAQVSGASPQLIKKVVAELKREGRIELRGRGRSAVWSVTG